MRKPHETTYTLQVWRKFLYFVLPDGVFSLKKGRSLTTRDCYSWNEEYLGENTQRAALHSPGQVWFFLTVSTRHNSPEVSGEHLHTSSHGRVPLAFTTEGSITFTTLCVMLKPGKKQSKCKQREGSHSKDLDKYRH